MTLDSIDAIVYHDLRTDMLNRNGATSMQDLFTSYHAMFSRHRLKWIVNENRKIAVQHVLSAARLVSLREHLTSDLSFSHHRLHNDFTGFLKHAVRVSQAFQLVDSGLSVKDGRKSARTNKRNQLSKPLYGNLDESHGKPFHYTDAKKEKVELLLCLWEPHRSKGLRHLLKDCRDCLSEEKERLCDERS